MNEQQEVSTLSEGDAMVTKKEAKRLADETKLQMQKAKRQARVKSVVDRHLRKGTVAQVHNLEQVAFTANYYRLNVSRQTLHHWYRGAMPKRTLLEGYITRLEELAQSELSAEHQAEVKGLYTFFKGIWDASYGDS
jgi:hypothetical protein